MEANSNHLPFFGRNDGQKVHGTDESNFQEEKIMSNMVVRTNVFALNAHRNMKNVGLEQGRASNRLSSGYRINSAADDAAGLAISETMRAQIRGLDQASRNAQDGQSMLLTTEGGLDEITNMLQRVRELLVQASNDTNTQDQRQMIEQEISQLGQEIGSMQQRVEFNTNRVLAMGPALDSAIANATSDIEQDGIRVSDAFALIDANRTAVADAREMLASLDGQMTFDQLNSRQQSMVNRALSAVELDSVTGGVVTTVNTNIPGNIQALNPMDLTPDDGASAALTRAEGAYQALLDLEAAHAAATAMPSTTTEESAARYAALTAAYAAMEAAGFDDANDIENARNDLRTTITAYNLATGSLATAQTTLETAQGSVAMAQQRLDNLIAEGASGASITAAGASLAAYTTASTNATVSLAEAQAGFNTAETNMNNEVADLTEAGLQVVGNTVTNLIGALNDRDTELADRTATLNQVRAEMLAAAEVQFGAMNEFANAHTSGDFVAFFQVGANANQGITFDFETVSRTVSAAAAVVNMASILVANPGTGGGVGRGIEVSPVIEQIQASLDDINSIRANLGAVQNRMDYTMRSLDISSENLQNSESRVRDADMAREMMRFTMANVLQQASISMLSQANQMPNNLLQILR